MGQRGLHLVLALKKELQPCWNGAVKVEGRTSVSYSASNEADSELQH